MPICDMTLKTPKNKDTIIEFPHIILIYNNMIHLVFLYSKNGSNNITDLYNRLEDYLTTI